MAKILVTGGNGFIGQYVVEELSAAGHNPVIFDRTRQAGFLYETVLGDIRDATSVTEAFAHVDGFIHLAGVLGTQETISNPRPAAETNILGGLNILEAAAQYNVPGVNIAVGNYWMNNTYSITKTAVERFVDMYNRNRGTQINVVRALNAYGPRQSIAKPYGDSRVRKIMPSFICKALLGQPIEVYGDGLQIMDMVYVEDVAWVLRLALDEALEGSVLDSPVDCGTGRLTTVLDIANSVIESVGSDSYIKHLPMRPGEPDRSTVAAGVDSLSRLGVDQLDLVQLEQGVGLTVDWFERNWLPEYEHNLALTSSLGD